MFILQQKLKHAKSFLKPWANTTFGKGDQISKRIREELYQIQNDMVLDPYNEVLSDMEHNKNKDLVDALQNEIYVIKEKLGKDCFFHGDRNSAFYHNALAIKRSKGFIHSIIDQDGIICTEDEQIDGAFVRFFETCYMASATPPSIGDISLLSLPTIKDTDAAKLVQNVTYNEIKEALFDLNPSSVGGPDGYNTHFFKTTWHIIDMVFVDAIQFFFSSNTMLSGINATNIAIIPKTDNPTAVSDYRPISCCNVIYRCITKILANRIKPVLCSIISPNQTAFLPNRNITDNILLTHELLKGYNRKHISPRGMMKLDIKKAFDSIEWLSIVAVMTRMGFPETFMAWIYTCISSPTFTIMINGHGAGYFSSSRGIRQGDPISPYIFILVMEMMSCILKDRVENKRFKTHPKCGRPLITSLMFADDIVIFAKPDQHTVTTIVEALHFFHCMTGLNINKNKSHFLIAGLDANEKDRIITLSGLLPMPINSTYLGIPLTSSRITLTQCLPLYEKIIAKLKSWPTHLLSQAGRITIVKSIVFGMTTYWSRIYILPTKLINMINAAMNHFIWHGDCYSRKPIPIAFTKLCRPKNKGGLGIIDLHIWNKAAASKHINDLLSHKDTMLTQWIWSHYLRRKNFWMLTASPNSSWFWKSLLRIRQHVLPIIKYNIYSDTPISFWYEPWSDCGVILNDVLNHLQKTITGIPDNATVADFMQNNTITMPSSSSAVVKHLWEKIMAGRHKHTEYFLQWTDKHTVHSIRSIYTALHRDYSTPVMPWSSRIWNCMGSEKENFMLWRTIHNALLTRDKLVNRGFITENMCTFCHELPESRDHLLFQCTKIYHMWKAAIMQEGVYYSNTNREQQWYEIFKRTRWKNNRGDTIILLLKCFIVNIWKERNLRLFEGRANTRRGILTSISSAFRKRMAYYNASSGHSSVRYN